MKIARVLILDDESTLRTALFRLLDRKGYNVVTAQSIEEAKNFCKQDKPFDLAILDMNLPDGDGLEFMDFLKNENSLAAVLSKTAAKNK